MSSSIEEIISAKLDMLIRLQALSLVSRMDSQKEKIIFLKKAGISNKEIADILGTSPNTVNVTLVKVRKLERKEKVQPELNEI